MRKKSRNIVILVVVVVLLLLLIIISTIDSSLDQAITIRYLGIFTIISLISLNIFDLVVIIVKKKNFPLVTILNFILSLFLFLLIEFLFLGNIFENVYVWSYSSVDTPFLYKSVAIWAGEAGSIITWMVMNSFMILIYRLKSDKIESKLFSYSVIISLVISVVFFVIIAIKAPFRIADIPSFAPNGLGLNPLLHSLFMVWHPLFVFLAYATFLIPFTISVIKIFKPEWNLDNNPHQNLFYNFSLKFGWLNITLAIGLGAFWASQSLSWGRFWGWDPVETVSLLPWIFITAYFHSISFKKDKKHIKEITIVSTFLSVVFSTLITRGGGFNSLHAFTGTADLLYLVIIVGILLVILGIYLIFISFDMIVESFPNVNKIVDYGSFLSFILLAFVFIFGLIVSPITLLISLNFNTVPLYLNINYYSTGALIPAILIGISLIFCSLRGIVQKKTILIIIIVGLLIQSLISYLLKTYTDIQLNPLIAIFIISIIATLIPLIKNFSFAKGYGRFFKVNGRHIIHLSISFILVGTLAGEGIIQTIVYFVGFILSLLGIIPLILIPFIKKKESGK